MGFDKLNYFPFYKKLSPTLDIYPSIYPSNIRISNQVYLNFRGYPSLKNYNDKNFFRHIFSGKKTYFYLQLIDYIHS